MSKDLIEEGALEKSAVVANCCMNRERNLYGSNGYDKELRCDPLDILRNAADRYGQASWLDLCCGTGKALIEAASVLEAEGVTVEIVGVDLAGLFLPENPRRVRLVQASLTNWEPGRTFDLITCVHGLHYIGDKLGLMTRARSWLKQPGELVANLDANNLKLEDSDSSRSLVAALRKAGFEYSAKTHLLQCNWEEDHLLPFEYLGADDRAGPNYTGQPVVDSYYRRLLK